MDQPPSYDSLFGKIAQAKVTSDGNVDFARKSIGIVCNSVIATVLLVVSLAVPVAAIVIGGLYLNDCPKQKYIPIYLIVFGAFSIVKAVSSLVDNFRARKNEGEQEESKPKSACDGIIGCFLFAWFIAGNVWVYSTYKKFSTDELSEEYCQPTLFYFSFWLITGTYIIMGLFFLLCCGCCISMLCCSAKMSSYGSPTSKYGV
ncbi:transmembrane protein 272-like [Mytilus trossulus]|uniref:transmembrane protein 272-like n=1 Tax=Mytilus trossulus TaxID=6551 RepID=UPI003005AEDF